MVNMCCVPSCTSTSYSSDITLFSFTTNPSLKKIWIETIRSNPITTKRKQKPFTVKKHTKICSKHFIKSDIRFGSDRHRLKPEAVPSIFPWTTKPEKRKRGRPRRASNTTNTNTKEVALDPNLLVKEENITVEETVLVDIKQEVEEILIKQEEQELPKGETKRMRKRKVYRESTNSDEELFTKIPDSQNKSDLNFKAMYFDLLIEYNEYKKRTIPPAPPVLSSISANFSIETFLADPEEFEFYTGLPDYSTFQILLNILIGSSRKMKLHCNYSSPSKFSQKAFEYKRLTPENELFLVLVKLRLDFDFLHLAHLFRLVPLIVRDIFGTWVRHMCARFQNLDMWPHRKVILAQEQEYAPSVVGSLSGVEFLLRDGKTESVITAKGLVVTDLIGAVIFTSTLFASPVQDRELIEKSQLSKIIQMKIEKKFLYSNDVLLGTTSCKAEQFLEPIRNVHIPVVQMKTMEFSLPRVDNVTCKVGYGEFDKIIVKKAFSRFLKYKILMKTFQFDEFHFFNSVWVVCCTLSNFQNPQTLTRLVRKHCF